MTKDIWGEKEVKKNDTITFKKKTLERFFFVLVIGILLLIFIILPKIYSCENVGDSQFVGTSDSNSNIATISDSDSIIQVAQVSSIENNITEKLEENFNQQITALRQEMQSTINELKDENSQLKEELDNITAVESDVEPEFSGEFDFTINRVDYEIKGTWGKILRINIHFNNQNDTLTPQALIYVWDKDDEKTSSSIKNTIQGNIKLADLVLGETRKEDLDVSINVDSLDLIKNVRVKILNYNSQETIADETFLLNMTS